LIFHTNVGAVPPFSGIAVNVTEPPEQTVDELAVMVTAGVTVDAVMATTLLVAVGVVRQASELAMTTLTTSPSPSEDDVKVSLFVPALIPLTCH
jgi:hypothetical protein